jgi:prolyl-tRNA synthetase
MLCNHGLKRSFGAFKSTTSFSRASIWSRRELHYDGRNRLSNFWTPTKDKRQNDASQPSDLLVDAGFLRQVHSGIFHLLPLGLRVQNKIEALIDKHMSHLGASKVSLSSISSEELWQKSGRLEQGRGSELFRLEDRKEAKYILSPTHEEEITNIVANDVHSYKQLPLRLYQVSRKYRDEARPRQGLLRGREFLMKDLYTFDVTEEQARKTYEDVRKAYCAFLDELRLPYLVASASSGNMGGKLSHEYHFASANGEDTIIQCDACDYSVNEEIYIGRPTNNEEYAGEVTTADFLSKDRKTWLQVVCPSENGQEINPYALKALFPEVDTSLTTKTQVLLRQWMKAQESPDKSTWARRVLYDPRISGAEEDFAAMKAAGAEADAKQGVSKDPSETNLRMITSELEGQPVLLTKPRDGDTCPSCDKGHLHLHKAVEIGHTFHLGTRYSEPLNLRVTDAENKSVHVSMGCHGIGISRLIAAVASLLSNSKGLNWPRVIAPFEVVIVPGPGAEGVDDVYDELATGPKIDAAIDDREQPIPWRLKDADLVGYPFIVVLGKRWRGEKVAELQCRRLGVKEEVVAERLAERVKDLSSRL